MTGQAVIAPYLKCKIKTADSDECRWCEVLGKRQSWEHLFKECLQWKEEVKELWRKVRRVTGWHNVRWKCISALLNVMAVTGATLNFLDKTGVDKMRGGINPEEVDYIESEVEE
jgi:hypothetical protein